MSPPVSPSRRTRPWWEPVASLVGRWGGGVTEADATTAAGAESAGAAEAHTRRLFQAMAVFRFLSFALGVSLLSLSDPDTPPPLKQSLLTGLVGAYSIGILLLLPGLTQRWQLVTKTVMAGDALLAVALVLVSGGLDSPFLVYSLAPVITAALFLGVAEATAIAVLTGVAIPAAHEAARLDVGDLPSLVDGNRFAIAAIYSVASVLVAYLPFLTNLNSQARVRSLATQAERQRLRREVHDDVAQTLAFLTLKMRLAEERSSRGGGALTTSDVAEVAGAVRRSYMAVRDYLDGAGEPVPAGSLGDALAAAATDVARSTGLAIDVHVDRDQSDLPDPVRHQLLQIAREALANAAKHAFPRHIWVEWRSGPEGATLRVRDDGRGFSSSQPKGYGLDIMEERASAIGASLTISSTPGEGAEVVVGYPFRGAGGRR